MKNFRHLLSLTYPLLKTYNYSLINKSKSRLRVLIFHDIRPEQEQNFSTLLKWLSKSWNFIDPKDFESILNGSKPVKGNNLLLSFDDGYISNRKIADEILNPMGIHALFFVVSDFISINNLKESKDFVSKNFFPRSDTNNIINTGHNMSWLDLEALLKQGHMIGAHTKTHARLSDTTKFTNFKEEIIDSANTIEQQLGIEVSHFAFTFGDLQSMTKEALLEACNRFEYIYTGLRGNNTIKNISKYAIRRDPIDLNDSLWMIGSLLEGAVDWRYKKNLIEYESWLK